MRHDTPHNRKFHNSGESKYRRVGIMQGHKIRLNSVAYSSIADWVALNSNELTWIVLVTVGVIAVGILM
jgi:hypothetical protein